jgi:hypothetical protein
VKTVQHHSAIPLVQYEDYIDDFGRRHRGLEIFRKSKAEVVDNNQINVRNRTRWHRLN